MNQRAWTLGESACYARGESDLSIVLSIQLIFKPTQQLSQMPSLIRFSAMSAALSMLLIALSAAPARAQDADLAGEDTDDPARVFERAQDAHAKDDLEQALKLYDAALKLRPEFPEAEIQKGRALISLGRLPEAEQALRRAVSQRPQWALPQATLGLLLVRAERDREAEPFLRRAVEIDSQDSVTLLALASLRLRAGAKDEALKLVRQATSVTDAPVSAWVARARFERAAGDKISAAASIERALQLNPNELSALEERALLRADEGQLEKAIEDLQIALRAQPDAPRLKSTLASFHARAGESYRTSDPARSLEHFRRALELQPDNVDYATGFAAALVQARRFTEAVTLLRRIIAAAPDNYAAHANLATALDGLKLYEPALVEYQWLAQAKPENAVTHFLIARCYDLLGEFELALLNYEKFLAQANTYQNGLEIERVQLRLPSLRNQIKRGAKKKR